jgi:hypothetical protein
LEKAVQLTKFQRTVLTRQLLFKDRTLTLSDVLRINAADLTKVGFLLVLLTSFTWWLGAKLFAAALAGFMVGVLFYAIASLNRAVQSWGITQRMTKWDEVERLLGREPQA